MAKESGPMSGFRDMLAETAIPRTRVLQTIQRVYQTFGFAPLETPALERLETLTGKYGAEGEKLIYAFKDHGGRNVALRYDLTIPLARVVAQYGEELPSPYKRYQLGNVWRGDSPQAGRYREFTQFDVDIVGTTSPVADAEIIAVTAEAMTALGATCLVRVNNRKILDALASDANLTTEPEMRKLVGAIDKVDKKGRESVVDEILHQFGSKAASLVDNYLSLSGNTGDKLSEVKTVLSSTRSAEEGIENLTQVFDLLRSAGYTESQATVDLSIARGLDYYTGIVYEAVLTDIPDLGSVSGGGRYDNLIAALGGPDKPAVGISIGVDRLLDGLQRLSRLESPKTPAQVTVVNFGPEENIRNFQIATELRKSGIPTDLTFDFSKIGKQLKRANDHQIPIVVMSGSEEAKNNQVTIKDLRTGQQIKVPLTQMVQEIKRLLD